MTESPSLAPPSLAAGAVAVLTTADPAEKISIGRQVAAVWAESGASAVGSATPPDRPARPARPELLPPGKMKPRRSGTGPAGRIALLHALAHIELNAIDLAWDLIARFGDAGLPVDFARDWLKVAIEESLHFELLAERLAQLGAAYGDLPAHDGLWQAAEETRDDLLARLAVVPLVLEARGLDVTPGMIERLKGAGDHDSVAILERIYQDEIGHVATGWRWFTHVAQARGLDPQATWPGLVRRHFRGPLKPPFNDEARAQAGLAPDSYRALAG